uniref:Putative ovule protein n=1 Tax=Solanum chacoense TaxID=4108 RepID=A0A0V0GLU0_SOLCH
MEKELFIEKSSKVGKSRYELKSLFDVKCSTLPNCLVYTGTRKHKNKAKYSNLYTRRVPTNGMLNTGIELIRIEFFVWGKNSLDVSSLLICNPTELEEPRTV